MGTAHKRMMPIPMPQTTIKSLSISHISSSPGTVRYFKAICSTRGSYDGGILCRAERSPMTTARGFPITRQKPLPVSCSRRYKRSLRARTGSGNTPSGKQRSRPNKKTRHDKGGNIVNDVPVSPSLALQTGSCQLCARNYFHALNLFMFVIINNKLKLIRQYPYVFICGFCTSGWFSPLFI